MYLDNSGASALECDAFFDHRAGACAGKSRAFTAYCDESWTDVIFALLARCACCAFRALFVAGGCRLGLLGIVKAGSTYETSNATALFSGLAAILHLLVDGVCIVRGGLDESIDAELADDVATWFRQYGGIRIAQGFRARGTDDLGRLAVGQRFGGKVDVDERVQGVGVRLITCRCGTYRCLFQLVRNSVQCIMCVRGGCDGRYPEGW